MPLLTVDVVGIGIAISVFFIYIALDIPRIVEWARDTWHYFRPPAGTGPTPSQDPPSAGPEAEGDENTNITRDNNKLKPLSTLRQRLCSKRECNVSDAHGPSPPTTVVPLPGQGLDRSNAPATQVEKKNAPSGNNRRQDLIPLYAEEDKRTPNYAVFEIESQPSTSERSQRTGPTPRQLEEGQQEAK